MEKSRANDVAIADMEDILQGLKVLRDHLDHDQVPNAKQILEQVGHRLAGLINECKAV
jgi:hypothetical protein